MAINVFDFFSGCGGTSQGFQDAGLNPVFALDFDQDASNTYKHNFKDVHVKTIDIRHFPTKRLLPLISQLGDAPTLFCGCAPCQPFTKQNTDKPQHDKRVNLLTSFGRFVHAYLPHYIFIENVPGFQGVNVDSPLLKFCTLIEKLGYIHRVKIIEAQDYGVPQCRRRLVLIASRVAPLEFPAPTHGPDAGVNYSTVRDWIAGLPPLSAGESHPDVPNHRAASLAPINQLRIRSTPPEQDRRAWPKELQLNCHRNHSGHTDVYGRMKWDAPASGLTTKCISLSNGRYGHPEQHRAISVREAACLQTFPRHFEFFGSLQSQARQIGNAVPAKLAEVFGRHFSAHWEHYKEP